MKNYDDIINRFDDIQDLPVSEEMLGAYVEGNLDCYEMESVSKLVNENDLLRIISEDTMYYMSTDSNHNVDLTDIESKNDSVTLNSAHNNTFDVCRDMFHTDENIDKYESYIEDYEFVDNNDSIDDSSFELPETLF